MKKLIYFISFLFLLAFTESLFAQLYNINNIPDSLLFNANAIVRNSERTLTINDIDKAIMHEKIAISVLNKKGEKYGIFKEYYDSFREIKNIKAIIYNSKGEIIKKIKQKDINDYSDFSSYSLFSDFRYKHIKPIVNSYPYTVEYEFDILLNGLINYPSWYPIIDYNVSLEKSSYILEQKIPIDIRTKEYNLKASHDILKKETPLRTEWILLNMKVIEPEPYSTSLYSISPHVIISPNKFKISGYEGNMSSWNEFGKWINSLIQYSNDLSNEEINNIHNLTFNEKDINEKAKLIYNYVQNKTRYISIQLGIGGWQPFKASVVENVGYGDCKALSNYMQSLLETVGIKSYYTIVKSGKYAEPLIIDFPYNQFNHVILCIPNDNDTIWLECTNQRMPFGYLGRFTDDRNVLIIKEDGGEIAHTTVYSQDDNLQINKAYVNLNNDGSGQCNIISNMSGLQYDNYSFLLYDGKEDQKRKLYENLEIDNIEISAFDFEEVRNRIPTLNMSIDLKLNKYTTLVGNRQFLPLNLMNKWTYIPKQVKDRKNEVVIRRAYHDIDSITYKIPNELKIEHIPDSINIVSQFGNYSAHVLESEDGLTYIRKVKFDSGKFKPDEYDELREFYKKISKADKSKVILIKK